MRVPSDAADDDGAVDLLARRDPGIGEICCLCTISRFHRISKHIFNADIGFDRVCLVVCDKQVDMWTHGKLSSPLCTMLSSYMT